MNSVAGKKIFVGLSGGVDSAVTAALLKGQNAQITGVFIKGWYPPGMSCTWADDRRDAMRVAAHLGIPFHTLDASEEYKKGVIDYLLREYKAGRTPNPDIMCNREVKFGAFYNFARAQGADFIATGHYAQSSALTRGAALSRGTDPTKDQSYFLWAVPKEVLSHVLFPLGDMEKSGVRELAKKFNLPNATKRDSQGICFLGNVSVEEFLTQEFGAESGPATDTSGAKIGIHAGVLLSTLGQRVHLEDASPGPWYVIAKDIATSTLIVSKEMQNDVRKVFTLSEVNWIEEPKAGEIYTAQYRYHGPTIQGTVDGDKKAFIPTHSISESIASGQSLVIYKGSDVVGGGIIG